MNCIMESHVRNEPTHKGHSKKLIKSFKKCLPKRPSVLIFHSIYCNYSVPVGKYTFQGMLRTSFIQQNSQSLQNHDSFSLFFAFINIKSLYILAHICYVICSDNLPLTRKDLVRKDIINISRPEIAGLFY